MGFYLYNKYKKVSETVPFYRLDAILIISVLNAEHGQLEYRCGLKLEIVVEIGVNVCPTHTTSE